MEKTNGVKRMKNKLSISVDKEAVKFIEFLVKDGRFRNKSHVVEYALNKLSKNLNEIKIKELEDG